MNKDDVFNILKDEIKRAAAAHKKYNSAHEGYAVILEELDELWEEVKKKQENRDVDLMRKEVGQLAVTAIRFMLDLT